jgi:hypothetical protein
MEVMEHREGSRDRGCQSDGRGQAVLHEFHLQCEVLIKSLCQPRLVAGELARNLLGSPGRGLGGIAVDVTMICSRSCYRRRSLEWQHCSESYL